MFTPPNQELFKILPEGNYYIGYGHDPEKSKDDKNQNKKPYSLISGHGTVPIARVQKGKANKIIVQKYIDNELYAIIHGVGFCLSKEEGILVIDLDHCFADDGSIYQWAELIIKAFSSLTLESPSGTGIHIFVKNFLADFEINKGVKLQNEPKV